MLSTAMPSMEARRIFEDSLTKGAGAGAWDASLSACLEIAGWGFRGV